VLKNFYDRLINILPRPVVWNGHWQLLQCVPAWDGNYTFDSFIAYAWLDHDNEYLVVCVNYADHYSQCYVHLPFKDLGNYKWQFRDLMSDSHYEYDGNDLQSNGLYLDMKPWQYHIFEMKKISSIS
jgi:hypothetical protein